MLLVIRVLAMVSREPGRIHRARMYCLEPRAAHCRSGQEEDECEQPGPAEEMDHRALRYVLPFGRESARRGGGAGGRAIGGADERSPPR